MSHRVGERCSVLKKDSETVDNTTTSQEKLCFRERKIYTLVRETNKSIMQKYLTSSMNLIHWQVGQCNSYELGNRCYSSAANL